MGKAQEDKVVEESKLAYVRRLSKSIASRSADFSKVLDFFERQAKHLSFVQCVSAKLNVAPGVVLLVMSCLALVFFVSRLGGSIICDAVGFLYPSYKSYKVLKFTEKTQKAPEEQSSESTADGSGERVSPELAKKLEENRKQLIYWTKYWVVFSLGFIFNYFANMFLFWLPFFYLIKLLFIVLLLHPKLQGAELIYNYLIAPILNKYETTIDNAVNSIEVTADQLITRYGVEKISGRLKEYATRTASNL